MKDSENKRPLKYESMFDLRDKLTEVYSKGGLKQIVKQISEEFTT